MSVIDDFRKKRAERLALREKIEAFKQRRAERMHVRFDDEEDQGNNNNNRVNNGKGSGGHGNTRLPFGLCKRFGIEIEDGWTPKDAWAALSGMGITADGAYEKLKKGEDPGTSEVTPKNEPEMAGSLPIPQENENVPEVPEKPESVPENMTGNSGGTEWEYKPGENENVPKEPKRDIEIDGTVYKHLTAYERHWDKKAKYTLSGKEDTPGGYGRTLYKRFATKTDMYLYLKEKGIEEFKDPETGEIVNPSEMELPKALMPGEYGYGYYKALSIGLRDGSYKIIGTGMEGKKSEVRAFTSLAEAMKYLRGYGVSEEDVKLSPALKKREKERVGWLTSAEKEYIEKDGTRYGDLELKDDGWRWMLTGSDEEGIEKSFRFTSKIQAMKYLQEQGVHKVRIEKEAVDPTSFKIPATIATMGGYDLQKMFIHKSEYSGEFGLYGVDLDGKEHRFLSTLPGESYDEFEKRIKEQGADLGKVDISDGTKAMIEERRKEDAERERIKKEWEQKSIPFGYGRYADPKLERVDENTFRITGFNRRGERVSITYGDDMYGVLRYLKNNGVDISQVGMNDDVRAAYEKHQEEMRTFDARSFKYLDESYVDPKLSYDGMRFTVTAKDRRGREREIISSLDHDRIREKMSACGLDVSTMDKEKSYVDHMERMDRVKKAIDSGEYYSLGMTDNAYKDIKATKEHGRFTISGTDIDGKESKIGDFDNLDAVIEHCEDQGIKGYKISIDGREVPRPNFGMHHVKIKKKPDGGYLVYATSKKFGDNKVMHESPNEQECRDWVRKNNVDDSMVRTLGMNPNDDIPRMHTAASLAKFDSYRETALEKSFLSSMTDEKKKQTADMLTEIFNNGELRVARSTKSFAGIVENGYKSQLETGTGGHGAAITRSGRKQVSETMYGHSGLADEDYEKCGYLGFKSDEDDFDDSYRPFYGSITWTLRKDRMKDRVTYTYGDSLNRRYSMSCAGYGGDKPTIDGMSTITSEKTLDRLLHYYNDYKAGKISYADMFRNIRSSADNNYIECQYHGPVTIEDFSRCSFNTERDLSRTMSNMNESQRKNVLRKIKNANVELVYRPNAGGKFVDAWDWIKEHYPADIPA